MIKLLSFISFVLIMPFFVFSQSVAEEELPVDESLIFYEEPELPEIEDKKHNPFDITNTAEDLPVDPEFEDKPNSIDAAAFEKEIQSLKTIDSVKEANEKKKLKDLCKKAYAQCEKGNYKSGISIFSEVLKVNKNNKEAADGINKCREMMESEIAEAIENAKQLYSENKIYESYEKLLSLCSKYPEDNRAKKIIENMSSDLKKAAAELNKKAIIFYQENDLKNALLNWEKALKLFPEDDNIKNYISRTNKKIEAIKKLENCK